MCARIYNQSDILEDGRIMLLTDSAPGCYTLTDLQYLEHTLREVMVEIQKSIQEAISNKNMFTFEEYVEFFASVTGSLKIITESLLAVKIGIQNPGDGSMDQEVLET